MKNSKSIKINRFSRQHYVLFSQSLSHPYRGGLVGNMCVAKLKTKLSTGDSLVGRVTSA